MATIHRTTMTPGKLEMLAAWLPSRPWFRGSGAPVLARAGGFRLDDPDGEVGIEFTFVRDEQGDEPITYHVPVSFRGAPLDGHENALIATADHGVLGPRWVYDGTADRVLLDAIAALLAGTAIPQDQNVSDTVETAVAVEWQPLPDLTFTGPAKDEGPDTVLPVRVSGTECLLRVHRVLGETTGSGPQVLAPVFSLLDADGRAAGETVRLPVISIS